jgi:hypothetical protein
MTIGDRARFVGPDPVFHFGERQGKVGTITLMLPSYFGEETCRWQPDNDPGTYVTDMKHLVQVLD